MPGKKVMQKNKKITFIFFKHLFLFNLSCKNNSKGSLLFFLQIIHKGYFINNIPYMVFARQDLYSNYMKSFFKTDTRFELCEPVGKPDLYTI